MRSISNDPPSHAPKERTSLPIETTTPDGQSYPGPEREYDNSHPCVIKARVMAQGLLPKLLG